MFERAELSLKRHSLQIMSQFKAKKCDVLFEWHLKEILINVFISRDSFVLNDEQSKWVNSAREQIYKLIKETPPNGAQVHLSLGILNVFNLRKYKNVEIVTEL